MKFPARFISSFEDATLNFEALEAQNIYTGTGAPTFLPDQKSVSYYFRLDPGMVGSTHIYYFNGTSWAAIV